ncbi:MAG TPA: hypothetical protein VFU21_20830 [Kofleriaceae bacterium]|nr:hypothetical protein [Kofleriaceae bacterium]
MRLVVGVSLVGAAAFALGCGGEESGSAPATKTAEAAARADKKQKEIKGPFANAVQVSEHGWMMTGDLTPPPVERESVGVDEDGDGETDGGGGGGGDRGGGGAKKKRFGQSPLYVDGKPVAVVAYGELPPWLPTRPIKLNDGREVIRFLLAEYFEAVGVPVGKIREVHLYGGRGRIAIIPGKEIRRLKKQLMFSFTEGDNGKMRMHWDHKLDVSDTIDKVQAVAIYIEKKAPRWDRGKWGLVDDAGVKIEGIPFVEHPLKGGVRFYLDGRIAHHLKRNRTFDRKVEPKMLVDGTPYFALFEYLEQMGVDTRGVVAMELLDKNRVVRRIEGAELARERGTIDISAPPAMSGQVMVHVGPDASRTTTGVSSVLLYTAKRARAHHRR